MIKTTTSNFFFKSLILGGASLLFSQSINAQVSLTTLNAPYTQNFNTLENTGIANTLSITGWAMNENGGGARDNELYSGDNGGSSTGDTYSYGTIATTERALGSLMSGTLSSTFGASFTNNTGDDITSLNISYVGEQWRLGTRNRFDSLRFQYSLNATSISDGLATWTSVNALKFISPDTVAPIGARNGNLTQFQAALSATIGSISIANGSTFFIRWVDINGSGADDGLAIDDFSITPIGIVIPRLNIMDVTLNEGTTGTTAFNFYAYLSLPAGAGGVTFDLTTSDNTAIAPGDYTAQTVTATIPQGANSYTFTILVNGDGVQELDEDFNVTISNVSNAVLEDGVALGTIINDDIIPPSITSQPENLRTCNGSIAMFMSQAFGDPTPTVKWQVSTNGGALWSDIPSQTTDMLMFTASISENGNMYRSIYTNSEGADTSYEATLYVNPAYNLNVSDSVCNNTSYQFPDGTTINNITTTVSHISNLTTILGCDSIINTTINVNPVYNINETASVCEGDNYTFPDGTSAFSITAQLFHTSNLTSMFGCDSIINTTVNVNMIDTTTATPISICSGDSVLFYTDYISTAGMHYYTFTNMFGCDSVIELNLTVNNSPIAAFSTSVNGGTVNITDMSFLANGYIWNFGDGTISNAFSNNPSYTYASNGTYTICLYVSNFNGCSDTSCTSVTIQAISINELISATAISVFPNPAHDKLSVEFATEMNSAKVSMVNMIGQVVLMESSNSKTSKIVFNLASIEAGVYYLLIENGLERTVRKVIVE